MAVAGDFLAHVQDLLHGLGPIGAKRMFGGVGLYAGEAIFGLILGDILYLKADDHTRDRFAAAGSQPFGYSKKGGAVVSTSYWSLPEPALEDADEALVWARLALEAARRKPLKAVGTRRPTQL